MHAIRRLGTAEEPLADKSRVDQATDIKDRRRSSLPEDLDNIFPSARWTRALQDEKQRKFPQTIAHRGYKAKFPENTMLAFREAIEAGAHAIETDVHLTRDGVAVLSHDPLLKRCYGRLEKVKECDWEFLRQLRTIREPHEPMPRLRDLLEYLAQPQHQDIWVLLDIKIGNEANDVMRIIAETIQSIDAGPRQWSQRIVLGVWAARYLPLCQQYLPGFAVSNIGFSTRYSRQFLKVPNVSFNMLHRGLFGPIGTRFMRDIRKAERPMYFWTVNSTNLMKWSIQQGVDGVITDDPYTFREMCNKWSDNEPTAKPTVSQTLYTFVIYFLLMVFWIPIKRRFPESVDTFQQTSNAVTQPVTASEIPQ